MSKINEIKWPSMPPSKGQSSVLFEDGYAEGWAKCLEACRAAAEAAAQHEAAPILKITGYQLREALDFAAPDGSIEQLEGVACIQHGPERTHDEGTDPAGLYCWLDDCPEEGSIPLTGDDARIIQATKPQQPGPRPPLTEAQIETIYLETLHTAEAEQMRKKNWLQLGVLIAEGWHGIVDKATGS